MIAAILSADQEVSMTDLTGRTIVVTGAGGGIGAAISRRIADSGARVVGLDSARSDGVRAFDVTDPRLWAALADELGTEGVHGLVNCAGITRRARLDAVTVDDMNAAYSVNVVGPMLAIQALSPLMPPGAS
ncbi:SDR family NAD(P)-dependent oxidoreductase, partial [Streptomyces sp. SID10244]|nr:SDR family NAD(P)-dependent oxidoreductase [Streptomyces sp. SID10244]